MKKLVAIGASTLALAMLPVAGAFAATTHTDTVSITVSDNCNFNTITHTDGDGSWSGDTLSATRSNGTVSYNLGKTNFTLTCNNGAGYKVAVKTLNNLVHGTNSSLTIPAYSGTAYTASVSGWSPIQAPSSGNPTASSTKYKQGDTVKTQSSSVSNASFSVFYGVGVSATQAAGTYTGTAVYELSKL